MTSSVSATSRAAPLVIGVICAATLSSGAAWAQTLIALRTLPAGAVIGEADIRLGSANTIGAVGSSAMAVGKETKATIYAGAPIFAANLRPPALVERNERVEMVFNSGSLSIRTEGRALDRGAAGERIRVMNLASRSVVTAVVTATGAVAAGR